MELYFYILDRTYEGDFSLRCEECEVIEKPKSYVPVYHWPVGVCAARINKSVVGGFTSQYDDIAVLYAKDHKKARELFFKRYYAAIRTLKYQLEKFNAMKEAVQNFEEKEW